MTSPAVLCTIDPRGVATLTLDRPAKSNAFDHEMRDLFVDLLAQLAEDPAVRVLVLRANGKHFCAGSDVSSMGASTLPARERVEMLLRLDAFPKPTVALVHGACLGAGVGLICCADIVVADPGAFFSLPELQLGIPPLALVPLIVRAIGFGAMRRYVLTGERFDGRDAYRIGLVQQLCAASEFDQVAAQLADHLLRDGPGATRALKQAWSEPALAELIAGFADRERQFIVGNEAQAGLASAREKRSPPWYPPRPSEPG